MSRQPEFCPAPETNQTDDESVAFLKDNSTLYADATKLPKACGRTGRSGCPPTDPARRPARTPVPRHQDGGLQQERFPTIEVYGNTKSAEPRLITCDGDHPATGLFNDNYVVFAELKSKAAG